MRLKDLAPGDLFIFSDISGKNGALVFQLLENNRIKIRDSLANGTPISPFILEEKVEKVEK